MSLPCEGIEGLAGLLGGTALGPPAAGRPSGYALDSRTTPRGGLFFAMPGERTDGHRFLDAARHAGAWGAVVADRERALASGLPCVLVPDVAAALWRLGEIRRGTIAYPLVGITGSNGKTSTKDLVAAVLSAAGPVAKSQGNFNNVLGFPISILNAPECARIGVFELGMSSRGEVDRLARLLRPRFGIITCIAEEHLEFLGTLEACREAEAEIIPHVAEDGCLLLSGDDPSTAILAARARPREVRRVSLSDRLDADAWFKVRAVGLEGTRGTLVIDRRGSPRRELEVLWPIPGRHMLYPLLHAVLLAAEAGIELDWEAEAKSWGSRLQATRGRMHVRTAGAAHVIDDSYNANPRSMAAALDFLCEVDTGGRKLAVLGDMLELGAASGASHRAVVERLTEDSRIARGWLVGAGFAAHAGLLSEQKGRIRVVEDKAALVHEIEAMLRPGDLLLVKGSRGIGLDQVADALGGGKP